MPIYEYRCADCKRRVSIFFRSFSAAESGAASATCPHCGGTHLERLVSKVSFIRSGNLGDGGGDVDAADFGDEDGMGGMGDMGGMGGGMGGPEGFGDMMGGLDEEDPRSIARWARQMQAQTGEDLGPEFNTALTRIESGEDPDKVMDDMEPELGGAAGGDGDFDEGSGGGDVDFD